MRPTISSGRCKPNANTPTLKSTAAKMAWASGLLKDEGEALAA
jgi:hypothetical protein